MTNTLLLRQIIKEKGLKLGKIAKELGISYPALKRLMENETQFKAGQIDRFCELLGIQDLELKEALFFCKEC